MPDPDKVPVLKITVSDNDTGDVLETLYTDGALLEVLITIHEHVVVFDTVEELADARREEEEDRG